MQKVTLIYLTHNVTIHLHVIEHADASRKIIFSVQQVTLVFLMQQVTLHFFSYVAC